MPAVKGERLFATVTGLVLLACLSAFNMSAISPPAYAQNGPAVIVNGEEIQRDEFDYAFKQYSYLHKRSLGPEADQAEEKLKKDFTDDLVQRQLLVQEGRRRGITAKVFAGEEEIDEILLNDPAFFTDGVFDRNKYQQFTTETSPEVNAARDRAEQIILSCKIRDIVPSKVMNDIRDELTFADASVSDEYLRRAERMKVRYLGVDPVSIANSSFITEDDVRRYYDDNPSLFSSSSLKDYWVLHFDPASYRDDLRFTQDQARDYFMSNPDEFMLPKEVAARYVTFLSKDYIDDVVDIGVNLRKYYEDHLDDFIEPEEVSVRILTIGKPVDKEKLASLQADISAGTSFNDLYNKYGDLDSSSVENGDLGYVKRGTLKEPLNSIAFGLKKGETSGIIDSVGHYYVLKVEDRTEQRVRGFDEVSPELERRFLSDAAQPFALADAKRFRIEAVLQGFDAAASRKNKVIYQTDYFKSSDSIPGIGINTLFADVSMSLLTGEVSDVVDFEDGFVVLQLSSVKPAHAPAFEDVSDHALNRMIDDVASASAESQAGKALKLVLTGASFEAAARATGAALEFVSVTATEEGPDTREVVTDDEGSKVAVYVGESWSAVMPFTQVSYEAASSAALAKADKMALDRAKEYLGTDWQTLEGVTESAPFTADDYFVDGKYMKPFIEQCADMKTGETRLISSLGKYYVVKMLGRSIDTTGREDEDTAIRNEVLKEKQDEHLKDWLETAGKKAVIETKI